MTRHIVIVEDEKNYRDVIEMMLAGAPYRLTFAADGEAGLAAAIAPGVDLVVTDLNMPKMGGLELLARLRARPDAPPVVVVTAYGTVANAVSAMREGAIDFLEKPFDEARLTLTLERALKLTDLVAENRRLRDEVLGRFDFSHIIGSSPPLLAALKTAGKVALSDSAVLVRGESGTGKELVARAIHVNSKRKDRPFVAVNCAAIPDGLLEAELFGAKAGAFTGATHARKGRVELAQGGTLFLDEIGDLPLPLQAKLLRLLQEKTFTPLGGEKEQTADVRFVCATHKDLKAAAAAGTFREDLYYRVSVVPVELPPLRARGDDVLVLARALAEKHATTMGKRAPTFTATAARALAAYPWPGNVRELANLVERAVILAEDDEIDVEDLALPASAPSKKPPSASSTTSSDADVAFRLPDEGIALEAVERSLVEQALERTGGNKSQAARLLGLSRATLRYRIEKMSLEKSGASTSDDE